MKVLVAPDSFKGTLTSRQAAEAIVRGLARGLPGAQFELVPLSDGGEGLVDALIEALGGERKSAVVQGPLGEPVSAAFALLAGGETAVIEMAAASGLTLVPEQLRDAERASTYGTGELVRAALDTGVKRIVVGIGGSATTDGGAGCAQALGAGLLEAGGQPIRPGGAGLAALARIEMDRLDPRVRDCRIEVACDVTNRLLGPQGAAAVFGPNKGLSPDGVRRMDANLAHLARIIARDLGRDVRQISGAGAAGGLGAGLVAFCGATLGRGIERVLDACALDARLAGVDLVVTGEGRIDRESACGKVPAGVAARAGKAGVPAVALVGLSRLDPVQEREMGLEAVYSVVREGVSTRRALADPARELEELAAEVAPALARLIGDTSRGRMPGHDG